MRLAQIFAASAVMVSAAMASEPLATRPTTLPAASQAATIPDGSELAQWIAQLNADAYATRDAATARLTDLPVVALPTVVQALAAKPLAPEAAARALVVLKTLRAKPAAVRPDDAVIPVRPIPIEPITLPRDLESLTSPDVDITSGAQVVTDTSAKIARLVQIIQTLNAKPKKLERQLKHGTAADTARLINELLDSGGIGDPGRTHADSEAGTNTVIINGPAQDVEMAKEWLELLEAAAAKNK